VGINRIEEEGTPMTYEEGEERRKFVLVKGKGRKAGAL